jgi:phospholipase/carboxylesterase
MAAGDASAARRSPQLTARPAQPTEQPIRGLHDLGLGKRRDGFVYVPENYDPIQTAPLMVLLHGAGGTAKPGWIPYTKMAESRGIILLAIDSRSHRTWDGILDAWGPDVSFIDEALARVFARYHVDAARIALVGFSDGASYALSLGAANGDLFTHVVAFAPGSIRPVMTRGRPRIFVSHGHNDPILSFQRTRDGIVPTLQRTGYDVTFRETNSDHEVSWDISIEMMDWILAR